MRLLSRRPLLGTEMLCVAGQTEKIGILRALRSSTLLGIVIEAWASYKGKNPSKAFLA